MNTFGSDEQQSSIFFRMSCAFVFSSDNFKKGTDNVRPVDKSNITSSVDDSSVLQQKFEELLLLLLDKNPERRGFCQTESGTRSWRDCVTDIQNTKVLGLEHFD